MRTPPRALIALLSLGVGIATATPVLGGEKTKDKRPAPALGVTETGEAFPPFARGDLVPAGLGPRQATPEIPFPGAATTRSIPKGKAVLSILVDADNRAVDFLVTSATDPAFGKALEEIAPRLTYQAARLKGTAIPARYAFAYEFEARNTSSNAMDNATLLPSKIAPGKAARSAHPESELDQTLELTRMALPDVPAGYTPPTNDPVAVLVTFFVDETGRVRIPNVESAADPVLVPGAIAAVSHWTFKPALRHGKPVLAFATRAVRFLPPAADSR
jgi:hypothetical protein